MGWQRKIPFGYQIKDGQPSVNPIEADAVRDIFARYQTGASYTELAASMERQGIPYHQHTPRWNKHMVKRILENDIYLGGGMYPKLIGNEDFLAVRLQRDGKNLYKPCPAHLDPIRAKLACEKCGTKLRRGNKRHGSVPWHCTECGENFYTTDELLWETVRELLLNLAISPELLIPPDPPVVSSPLDAVRIENELILCFNRGGVNTDYMKTLIFAVAAERYAVLPDPAPGRTLGQLLNRMKERPAEETDLWELLNCFVRVIRLGKHGETELELVNGMVMGRKESTQ